MLVGAEGIQIGEHHVALGVARIADLEVEGSVNIFPLICFFTTAALSDR